MASPRPELIFLAGPQAGERTVLMQNSAVAGRAPDAEVHLVEEFASRQHMRFQLAQEGWIVENLSPNRTGVNGKWYGTGRRILLATGDVLAAGRETQILFVAPGDDPEQALSAHRLAHPSAGAVPSAGPPLAGPPPPVLTPAPHRQPEAAEPLTTPVREARPARQGPQARTRKTKFRKYAILGGVYLVGLAGFVLFLSMRSGGGGSVRPSDRVELKAEDIRRILSAEPEAAPNAVAAREALDRALMLYEDRHFRRGNLYEVVWQFRLHLANKRDRRFDRPEHERMYRKAQDELIQQVSADYRNAMNTIRARDWAKAYALLRALQDEIPDPKNPLFQNVSVHLHYVKRQMPTAR